MRYAIAVLVILAGCASTDQPTDQKPRAPVIVGKEVKVGVKEKCRVEMPPEPVWQVDAIMEMTDPLERSKALLAELEQRRDWENKVKAAVKKCE